MQWFRVYHEARTDAKLESLTDAQHRVWFRLMCFAGEQPERGLIQGFDDGLLAVEVARGDVELLRATIARLVMLRVVVTGEEGVEFVNWEKRQYDKPSDAPEATRERKRRQRQRDTVSIEEPVTRMSRDVTPGHDTEAEADTDSDTEQAATGARGREEALVLTSTEETVLAALEAVPGLEATASEILEHYRSLPVTQTLTADDQVYEALKFRDFWTEKRKREKGSFRNWRNSMTNWYQRAHPTPLNRGSPNGRRKRNEPDNSGIERFMEVHGG